MLGWEEAAHEARRETEGRRRRSKVRCTPTLALTVALLACCSGASLAAPMFEVSASGELAIDGRPVTCKSDIQTILDVKLPNLGIATRTQLVLNPKLLRQLSPIVRMFVYHHECGHHHVGGDELGADCWAVRAGVASGWLHQRQLTEICASFGNSRATATHPATAYRCRALQACFADAINRPPQTTARNEAQPESASSQPDSAAPAPQLVHEGFAAPKSPER